MKDLHSQTFLCQWDNSVAKLMPSQGPVCSLLSLTITLLYYQTPLNRQFSISINHFKPLPTFTSPSTRLSPAPILIYHRHVSYIFRQCPLAGLGPLLSPLWQIQYYSSAHPYACPGYPSHLRACGHDFPYGLSPDRPLLPDHMVDCMAVPVHRRRGHRPLARTSLPAVDRAA